mgnify:CR=1 FL=1
MFSKKLDYYDKPCKWLKFLLNIWWPLSCISCLWSVGSDISSWENAIPSLFVLNIILTLSFFASDLLARFLDKTAMRAILFMEGLVILRSVWSLILMIIQSGEVMNAIPEQTGHGMISAYIGIAMAFTVLIVLVQILIAIITIMYVQKRKDLFLSSEKDLKKLYE